MPEKSTDPIKILVTFENESKSFDRAISINSKDIAPIKDKKSEEDIQFRKSLKPGDKIDCYDSTSYWYAATINKIETRKNALGEEIPMGYIAFRVLHEKGD